MTTYQLSGEGSENKGHGLRNLFIIIVLVVVLILAAQYASMMTQTAIHQPVVAPGGGYNHPLPQIVVQLHSVNTHGDAAIAARLCNKSHGVRQIFFQKETNRFLLLCLTDTGDVYVQVIEKIQNAIKLYREKTAFRYLRPDGTSMTWNEVIQYVTKTATRWTQPLP